MIFKRKKVFDFREYIPNSTLKVPRNTKNNEYNIIDAHIHLGPKYVGENFVQRYNIDDFVKLLKNNGVRHAIDLELFSEDCFERVLKEIEGYEDFFSFCAPVNLDSFEEASFKDDVYNYMVRISKTKNVCGFKVWKNLGLELRRKNRKLARIDDPEFDIIWKTCACLDLPVVIHVADPSAFFQKADKYNERLEELLAYPMWSYGQQSELNHEDIIRQFANVLERNPETKFIAAHIVSCGSDLVMAEELMTKYSNLYVDIAAVLSEIGRQPRNFSRFAEKFQDRILFGTDSFGGDPSYYPYYKRFLETDDEYFEYRPDNDLSQGRWRIYGCDLQDKILKKIYFDNAKKVFKLR